MTGAPGDHTEPLTLAEQVERIERSQEETRKFVAEQHKLAAEWGRLPGGRAALPVAVPEPARDNLVALVIAIMLGWGASFAAGAAFMRAWSRS